MYKIYANGELIHYDLSDEMKVIDPELELELNQAGSLKFSVFPSHPLYNKFINSDDATRIKRMKSIITVYRDNELVFRGRILEIEDSFYKQKQVTCEGELAFFIDSQLRPYEIKDTPENVLRYYVGIHNEQMAEYPEKQFVVGDVTITDGDTSNNDNLIVRSSDSIVNVWSEISSKLIENLGGYLVVDSDENGNRRINWLREDDFLFATQDINFGENLLDIKINVKGDEIATALIPVGGETVSSSDETEESTEETTGSKLSIASLPDGIVSETDDDVIWKKDDYIYSQKGVEEYGLIFATHTWQDIIAESEKGYLLEVAIEKLNESKQAIESIEINAVDLYKLQNVTPFRLGTRIKVNSKLHNLNDYFPLTKMSLNLSNPSSNTLMLTKTERSFTEKTAANNKVGSVAERIDKVENNTSKLVQTVGEFSSAIQQSSEEIMSSVSEKYYLKDEANTLKEEIETRFTQTSEAFEMQFNQLQEEAHDHYQEQSKYIRFEDGNIVLGETGNEITLKITNDKISFLQDGVEVAYFSNKKLYVLDGEFINSLKLGKFAFIPRSNGNLSFKKVT